MADFIADFINWAFSCVLFFIAGVIALVVGGMIGIGISLIGELSNKYLHAHHKPAHISEHKKVYWLWTLFSVGTNGTAWLIALTIAYTAFWGMRLVAPRLEPYLSSEFWQMKIMVSSMILFFGFLLCLAVGAIATLAEWWHQRTLFIVYVESFGWHWRRERRTRRQEEGPEVNEKAGQAESFNDSKTEEPKAKQTTEEPKARQTTEEPKARQSAPVGPYKVLGVTRDMSDSEIKGIYRALCKIYHPDTGTVRNHDKFCEVREAYEQIFEERSQEQKTKYQQN